jgi:hypothetical protein
MSAQRPTEIRRLDSSWSQLQELLLAPTPEALERALEVALTLRSRARTVPAPDLLAALETCRALALEAAGYYLRLMQMAAMRAAGYTATGLPQSPQRHLWALDA